MLHVSQKLFSNCKKKSNQEEVDMNYGALCYLENLGDLVIHYVRRSETLYRNIALKFTAPVLSPYNM